MLFVQRERSQLTPRTPLSEPCWRNHAALGISLLHGAGEGCWLHVFAGLSGLQPALVKWSLFTAVVHCKSGERDAEGGELLSGRSGCREAWSRGAGFVGEAAATQTSPIPPSLAQGPSYMKQNQCSGGCLGARDCRVGLRGKYFG